MTAGNQYTAATINTNAAQAVIQVRDALANLWKQYSWLNQLTVTGIENAPAAPGGTQIVQADAQTILAALGDLAGVYQFVNGLVCNIGNGASHVSGTVDLMTFGRQLTNGQ